MSVADTSKRQSGYDRLAGWYRALEWLAFRGNLQRARSCLLNQLPQVQRILVIGDGDGRLLESICLSQPNASVTTIDQSPRMLNLQRERIARIHASDRVKFICDDATVFEPDRQSFDLIVTAFFFDCFTEQELLGHVPTWLAGLRQNGHICIAEFTQPDSGWRAIRASMLLSIMHRFFRWQTGLPNRQLVDWPSVLNSQSLSLVASQTTNSGLMQTQIWRFSELASVTS